MDEKDLYSVLQKILPYEQSIDFKQTSKHGSKESAQKYDIINLDIANGILVMAEGVVTVALLENDRKHTLAILTAPLMIDVDTLAQSTDGKSFL